MNLLCRIIGHRFQDTVVIDQIGDFYDIQDGRYCRICGEVELEKQWIRNDGVKAGS